MGARPGDPKICYHLGTHHLVMGIDLASHLVTLDTLVAFDLGMSKYCLVVHCCQEVFAEDLEDLEAHLA